MATNVGTLVVTLEADLKALKAGLDQAGKETKTFTGKVSSWFGESKMAILSGATAIGAAAIKSIQAYGEQEQAIVKLNQALANQGIYSQAASDDLVSYASSLESVTTFADEAIIATQAQLTAFGLQGKQLKEVTKATLDLASAKGIDLSSAANLLGKAFVGETGALSRYGIVIDKNTKDSDKFKEALGRVNSMFGGQAEKERNTTLGQFKGMGLAFNNLQESIGSMLAGPATELMKWLTDVINKVNTSITYLIKVKDQMGGVANFIKNTFVLAFTAILQTGVEIERWIMNFIIKLLSMIPGVDLLLKKMGTSTTQLKATVATAMNETDAYIGEQGVKLQGLMDKWIGSGQTVVETEKKKQGQMDESTNKYVNNKKKEEEVEKASIKSREQAWIDSNLARMQSEEDLRKKLELETGHWADFSIDMANQVTDQFGQGMADMILEGKKFSDVIKGIWKSLANAIIAEIARMIAKWLVFQAMKSAAGGGFGGFFASGGIISEPSVITGLRSGISYVAGEAGPEAVVPMSQLHSAKAANAPLGNASVAGSDGGGGGLNVTVNISGQLIEGDETMWQRLIRDKVVPEIHRLTMSNPTGMFNRRRGATA
jgi:hypothetical protein